MAIAPALSCFSARHLVITEKLAQYNLENCEVRKITEKNTGFDDLRKRGPGITQNRPNIGERMNALPTKINLDHISVNVIVRYSGELNNAP